MTGEESEAGGVSERARAGTEDFSRYYLVEHGIIISRRDVL